MRKRVTIVAIIFAMLISSFSVAVPSYGTEARNDKTHFANVVLFAHFSGDKEGAAYFSTQKNLNAVMSFYDGSHGRSFKNYMDTISYGQFEVHNIFPQYKNGVLTSYELPVTEEQAQSQICDTAIIDALVKNIPGVSDELDYNGDGYIDNLTVILIGGSSSATRSSSLTSHKSIYPGEGSWNKKSIGAYNMLNTYGMMETTLPQESGVIAHEFLHTLGYPDLYTEGSGSYPVFTWDIMGSTTQYLQYPLAYLRKEFTDWVNVEEVTASRQGLTLYTQEEKRDVQAYVLKSPLNEHELFVVEYRKKTSESNDSLDSKIGGTGLIVYRVNTTVTGLSNRYEDPLGVYVFRPLEGQEGAKYEPDTGQYSPRLSVQNGVLSDAADVNRVSIGVADLDAKEQEGALVFSDGTNSGIVISNVKGAGNESMTFDVSIPDASTLDLWKDTGFSDGADSDLNKMVSLATDQDGDLYAATFENGSISVSKYNGTTWSPYGNPISGIGAALRSLDLLCHRDPSSQKNTLYLGYTDSQGLYTLKKYANGSWAPVVTGQNLGYDVDIAATDSGIFLVTAKSNSGYVDGKLVYSGNAHLYQLDEAGGKFLDLGAFFNSSESGCGQPKVTAIGSTVYTSIRATGGSSNDIIKVWQYAGSGFRQVSDDSIVSGAYDMEALENRLYVTAACNSNDSSAGSLAMYTYDGNNWQADESSGIDFFDPKLVASQGNLYVLITPSTGDGGATQVYSYNTEAGSAGGQTFTLEGNNVDSAGSCLTLVSSGSQLYVGYVRTTGSIGSETSQIHVRAKQSSNQLLSLTITPPDKTVYLKGDATDTKGLSVQANYVKTTKVLDTSAYTISGFTTEKTGEQTATVTYNGVSNTFTFEVQDSAVIPDPGDEGEGGEGGTTPDEDDDPADETVTDPAKEARDRLFSSNTRIRAAGADRYITSERAANTLKSAMGVQQFDNIIVACGSNYPDALSGSYLAKVKKAPILLVNKTTASERSVKSYITKYLKPGGTVYILGSTGVVTSRFQNSLSGIKVKRLGGSDRYATNLAILNEAGLADKELLVCTGNGYADSLSASAVGKPILLVRGNDLTARQKDYISRLKPNKIYLIGGESVVSKKMANLMGSYAKTERLGGKDRYKTSALVANKFFPQGSESIVLAYAYNFPDGLSGGPVAIQLGAPLLLVNNRNYSDARAFAQKMNTKKSVTLGGTSLISDGTVNAILR